MSEPGLDPSEFLNPDVIPPDVELAELGKEVGAAADTALAWIHRFGRVGRGCRNAESAFLYGRMTVFKAGHFPDQKDTFCGETSLVKNGGGGRAETRPSLLGRR